MKKSKLFLSGILGILLVFGLVLTGCPTDGDSGGGGVGEELPATTGENELSGKTYFVHDEKFEFAEGGTYKKSTAKEDENWHYVYDDNGKYTYAETENGSYSWNDTSKKIVLKPAKIANRDNGGVFGPLQDAAGIRQATQKMIDAYTKEYGEEAVKQQLASEGFSSVSAYIDYWVNETFANKTFAYALVANGAALLLSEELPSTSGANELTGQTFSGTTWDNAQQKEVKDTAKTYTFSGTNYTYTNSSYTDDNATGTYAWNTQRKRVYLKPATIGGKTNVEYFESWVGDYAGYYNTATEYNAAQTNGRFTVDEYPYNLTTKIVGWED